MSCHVNTKISNKNMADDKVAFFVKPFKLFNGNLEDIFTSYYLTSLTSLRHYIYVISYV